MPEIWIGVLMIGFLTNDRYVHWFPSNGLHDVLSDSHAISSVVGTGRISIAAGCSIPPGIWSCR